MLTLQEAPVLQAVAPPGPSAGWEEEAMDAGVGAVRALPSFPFLRNLLN